MNESSENVENNALALETSYKGSILFKTTETFETIKIGCVNATINLIYNISASGAVVATMEDENSLDQNDYTLKVKNHELIFSEHRRHYKRIFPCVLNFYIPSTAINTALSLHTTNGKINILGSNTTLTSNLDISSVNGELNISNISAPLLTIDTVNGKLNIEQSLFNMINLKGVNSHSVITFKASTLGAKLTCTAINFKVSVNGEKIKQSVGIGTSSMVLFNGSGDEFMELNFTTTNGSLAVNH